MSRQYIPTRAKDYVPRYDDIQLELFHEAAKLMNRNVSDIRMFSDAFNHKEIAKIKDTYKSLGNDWYITNDGLVVRKECYGVTLFFKGVSKC